MEYLLELFFLGGGRNDGVRAFMMACLSFKFKGLKVFSPLFLFCSIFLVDVTL